MKIYLSKFSNLILLGVLGFFLFERLPGIVDQFRSQGSQAPSFNITLLDGTPVSLSSLNKPTVLVFWATWCGPCKIELSRINKMIENKEIAASSVLAVASFEKQEVVAKEAQSRGYQFPVGIDPTGKMANDFKVAGTPTIVFIDKNNNIEWITTGLSPALGLRLKNFLGQP